MTNIIQDLENEQIAKMNKKIPAFKSGDTVKVMYKIVEDKGERLQAYDGVVIARSNNGLNSSFTVRKISFGEGVERVFPLYSPNVASIDASQLIDINSLNAISKKLEEKILNELVEKGYDPTDPNSPLYSDYCLDIPLDSKDTTPSLRRQEILPKESLCDPNCKVSSIDDIEALRKLDIYGAIVGKAYYTGAIDLAQAVKLGEGEEA